MRDSPPGGQTGSAALSGSLPGGSLPGGSLPGGPLPGGPLPGGPRAAGHPGIGPRTGRVRHA